MAGRAKEKPIRYYIGGKQYIPEESTLLCATDGNDLFSKVVWSSEKLYRTSKGTFFIIRESGDNRKQVELLDKEKAYEFMDRNTAGIITENYDRVLGVPEMG